MPQQNQQENKPISRKLKWFLSIVLSIIFVIALFFAYLFYLVWHNKIVVSNFCSTISIDETLESVKQKAKSNNIIMSRIIEITIEYQEYPPTENSIDFTVPGFVLDNPICRVTHKNDKILTKVFGTNENM